MLLGQTMIVPDLFVTSSWTYFVSCQVSLTLSIPSDNQPMKLEIEMD
jgi:hypothetical protein